jgi:hypothetical protein
VADTAEQAFAAMAEQMVTADPRVASPATEKEQGNRFGASGLKVNGKIFVMVSKGQLVFKLPQARVDELVREGTGARFDPGHGRLMKEWIALPPETNVEWRTLATEALAFVGKARTR